MMWELYEIKVLLEYNHALSFMYYLCLFSGYTGGVEQLNLQLEYLVRETI